MITKKTGNVLDLLGGLIVHGCNCQGVMGSGIAAQVRERFPGAYAAYREDYSRDMLIPGLMSWDEQHKVRGMPLIIVNAYTQESYGSGMREVSYDAVERVFRIVGDLAKNKGLADAICFPAIGAGLGGGNWKIIETIIDETLPDSEGFRKFLYVLPEKKHGR